MNAREVNVRQTEVHTDEPLVPVPSSSVAEIATENLKKKLITSYWSNSGKPDPSRMQYNLPHSEIYKLNF